VPGAPLCYVIPFTRKSVITMHRGEYYVSQHARRWLVQHTGTEVTFDTSKSALNAAMAAANTAGIRGFGGSVLIQRPSGEWKTQWTYGLDPLPAG
jgi:hypothetical protein